jgi:endonuclease/exonuclease/phosphatase family metal-dependent hydrolase
MRVVSALLLFTACSGAATPSESVDSGTVVDSVASDTTTVDSETVDTTLADSGVPEVATDAPAPAGKRVLTLNLRGLQDDWPKRKPIVVDALAAIDAEVMAFQECAASSSADNLGELLPLVAAKTKRTYAVERAVGHDLLGTKEGIAIVSTAPFDTKKTVDLPAGIFPRKLILVRVGGYVFGNAHLDPTNGGTRESQAKKIVAELGMFGAPMEPTVAMGDMNETDGDPVHKLFIDAGYADAWLALRPTEKGNTFPASGPDRRIDFIFTKGARATSVTTFLEMKVSGITGSDHLGVWATIAR